MKAACGRKGGVVSGSRCMAGDFVQKFMVIRGAKNLRSEKSSLATCIDSNLKEHTTTLDNNYKL